MEEEQKIDDFLDQAAAANAQPDEQQQQDAQTATKPTDEDIVELEARSGKPTPKTVLQKRTELSEERLEKRIEQISARYAGKIDEAELRAKIAVKLDQNDRISEADLVQIQDQLLREHDQKQQRERAVAFEPPFALSGLANSTKNRLNSFADRISALSTPGGIGILIAALILMVWIMIPTPSGQTRMQLLWCIITGQVSFDSEVQTAERDMTSTSGNQSQSSQQQLPNYTGGNGQIPNYSSFYIPTFEE